MAPPARAREGLSSFLPLEDSRVRRRRRREMGNTVSGTTEASNSTKKTEQAPSPDTKPKKKMCCACPDTKKLRDECIVQHGEDACGKWIEAHLQCLRAEGV
uniref:Cytochrome c oxidase copper chaperone n=1 Tax=Leersia perrieri TaxID=77586 RepID=A0A0D9XDT6_9ORYZ